MNRWLALACTLMMVLLSSSARANDYGDCQQEKNISLSIQACSKLIQIDSSNAIALFYRANAYWHKADYNRAFSDYNNAIRLRPDYAEAINGRGNLFRIVK